MAMPLAIREVQEDSEEELFFDWEEPQKTVEEYAKRLRRRKEVQAEERLST